MDLDLLERVKRFAIVSVVSNDELMEQLVLKGGNAIDLIYGISDRGSIDIDLRYHQKVWK
ncbi:MAG: nucleotidyl transferase AbiEii/AbiGii toxin family protein [Dehalococcoidia bacterium]|nr:nucleotidyl transferase AbiEii/AbiGii toxin family protein [Dehalococcoidia bacterium]